jgi:hypothetical protein
MASITSANAIITIAVTGLFNTPQQLQAFAADDIFDTDTLDVVETAMGVDGKLSGGKVNNPISQGFSLMADSPSIPIFDQWWGAMQVSQDVLVANGVITLPSLLIKYTLTKGFLTKYPPISGAKKTLQARKFNIVWESLTPSPIV